MVAINNIKFNTNDITCYVFDSYIKPYYKNKNINIDVEKLNANDTFIDGIINNVRFIINFNDYNEVNKFMKCHNLV